MMKNYTNIGLLQLIGDSSYLTSMYVITIWPRNKNIC